MKLLILVLVLCAHHGSADIFLKCFKVYVDGSNKPQTVLNHCSTIKNTSDCLGAKPSESSPLLDHMRFYILQHAMFDIHVELCTPYDYSQLKNSVMQTGLYKKFGHLFVDSDQCPQSGKDDRECALKVHLAAKKYYLENKITTSKQLLCDDARNLSRFYKNTAKNMKCKSEALKRFGLTIWHVVPPLNELILKKLHIKC